MVPEAPRQLSPGVPLGFWDEVVVLLSVDKSRDFDRARGSLSRELVLLVRNCGGAGSEKEL